MGMDCVGKDCVGKTDVVLFGLYLLVNNIIS